MPAAASPAPARILLVGGSPEPSSAGLVRRLAAGADAVVAVDRGLDRLLEAGVDPDLFCGDCDTATAASVEALGRLAASGRCEAVRYDPHKDATDLGLALGAVRERWSSPELTLTCFSGGRPDHALAVLGCIARAPFPITVEEDASTCRVLRAGDSWDIEGCRGRQLSLVALLGPAVVSERGMEWELDRATIEPLSDLGVSNVVRASAASVSCHEGVAAAYLFR